MRKFWIFSGIFVLVVLIFILILCLCFPRKYFAEIQTVALKYDLSPSLVASVINIESGYDNYAVSKVGARGLMQILPSTALDCADRMAVEITEDDLFDYKINLELGCFYLRYLLDLFDDNVINVLSAYNWGLGNVTRWIEMGNVDMYGTITNIPIEETSNYLRKFQVNKFVYEKLYKFQ